MKKNQLLLLLFMISFTSCAASTEKVIKLPSPNMNRPSTVMNSLSERKSTREYSDKELTLADLGDMLWAANGINRPKEGNRTAPSAMNKQDVDVYVIMAKGAYLYDAANHSLNLIIEGDHRALVAGKQDFVLQAPVSLVLVSDFSRLGEPENERVKAMGAVDVGIVSQNISIFCAAAKLATVPRASMEHATLKTTLGLTDAQSPIINHPVGYFK
ncbi:SagB/ThcOx family dehydrogenase [Bacteroides sp. 519]|uniref:SagB/ThcOx family dehydrogenase n=1 Tax=Bacteroides sp. 519 TaxID=2302937 RepID=UPI0013D61BAB|nr:SagB/ThcOx family dehydrogenase [Bacteroides sp. 519]NDV58599.1 SagB/ThcOx family dehydrogenase [Bacteroides sp. 519]